MYDNFKFVMCIIRHIAGLTDVEQSRAILTNCALDLDALRQNVQMCVGLIGACDESSHAADEDVR